MKRRNMRGFTLVELLIVLLILGILIGLAVPRYLEAVEKSKQRTFCANIRTIMSALETYRMDNALNQYPGDLSTLINDAKYFAKKPVNPWNNAVMGVDTGSDGISYAVNTNNSTYSITVTTGEFNYTSTLTCDLNP